MQDNQLYEIVKNIHDTIVRNKDFVFESKIARIGKNKDYKKFPLDRCHSCSEIIKRLLDEIYGYKIDIFEVNYGDGNHVFLENKDFIIDITAYQFNNHRKFPDFKKIRNFPEVIVTKDKNNYYFLNFEKKSYKEHFLYDKEREEYIDFYNLIKSTLISLYSNQGCTK